MTPDLALTLSYQGISLLTRVDGGWHLLGEVVLDAADLTAELAALREMARSVGGDGFTTQLVVPNDQIKFLTLPEAAQSDAHQRAQAAAALDGATPYAVDQLAFDVAARDGGLQVAAVAQDTLAEAEGFAIEHAFNPICFTAVPPEDQFFGAPDFGLTEAARQAGLIVDHDPVAMVVIGTGPLPKAAPPAPHIPEPLAEVAPAEEPPVEEIVAAPEAEVADEPAEDAPVAEAVVAAEAPEPAAPVAETVEQEAEPTTQEIPAPEETPEDSAPPAPAAFASVRAQRAVPENETKPALSGVTRDVSGTNAPSIPAASDDDTAELRFDPAKAVAGLTAERASDAVQEAANDNDGDGESGTFASARSKTKVAGPAPTAARKDPKPRRGKKKAAAEDEKQKLTTFGARKHEVGGKPRHLGLILTTLLLVFMGLVALWASLFLENGVAGLLGRDEPTQIVAAPVEDADEPPQEVAAVEVEPAELPSEPAEDVIAITVPDGLTPDSTDGEQTALLEQLAPEELAEDGEEIAEAVADPAPGIVTPEEAEAHYAVTGVWQRAPQPLSLQPVEVAENGEDIYVPAIDRLTFGLDAVALPSVEMLTTDAVLPAQTSPLDSSVAFDVDERGLVVATKEGALNADGVMVYAGRPPIVPAAYPKRIIVADALREQNDSRLAALRPKLRPSDLLEQNERASLGGLTRAELASIRPKPRPESAQDAAASNLAPTQFAVQASLRPRLKPANIAQLAARATQNEENTTTVAAAPAAATVVPAIPSTASVARQATINNAINLRKISLIGVYGTSSNRRALVRMPNGRYKKVQVGDRIDGGNVTAIGEDELRYTKRSRNLVLTMPKDG